MLITFTFHLLGLRSRFGFLKVKDEPPPWPVTVRFRILNLKG